MVMKWVTNQERGVKSEEGEREIEYWEENSITKEV